MYVCRTSQFFSKIEFSLALIFNPDLRMNKKIAAGEDGEEQKLGKRKQSI